VIRLEGSQGWQAGRRRLARGIEEESREPGQHAADDLRVKMDGVGQLGQELVCVVPAVEIHVHE